MTNDYFVSNKHNELCIEFYGIRRKIAIYPNKDILLKVWGSRITEMEDFSLQDGDNTVKAFNWLNEENIF